MIPKENEKSEHVTMLRFSPLSGLGGSRTRVQRPIPCPSTIIVNCFGCPHSLSGQEIDIPSGLVASSYAHMRKA